MDDTMNRVDVTDNNRPPKAVCAGIKSKMRKMIVASPSALPVLSTLIMMAETSAKYETTITVANSEMMVQSTTVQ